LTDEEGDGQDEPSIIHPHAPKDQSITEYNFNVNLDNILPSHEMSPNAEAIFKNFPDGENRSIDIRDLNNSESQKQLEFMMRQHLKKDKQINIMNTSR